MEKRKRKIILKHFGKGRDKFIKFIKGYSKYLKNKQITI